MADTGTYDCVRALEALEARGARAFDAASCDCVRTLIRRGETLDVRAGALLLERAHVHVERLARRFGLAQKQAAERLDVAEQSHGALPAERAALARGELSALRQRLRRLDHAPPPRAARTALARREHNTLEYESSRAELAATLAVARAVDSVPENAGPYNPQLIATELLTSIGAVSPIYLRAQLKRLDELANMLALPELPPKPTPAAKPAAAAARKPAARKRTAKRRA